MPTGVETRAKISSNFGPRSVLRVVGVLSELALSPNGVTLAELSDRLAYPRTSLFNILKSLEAGRYVRNVNGRYLVGAQALMLGANLSRASSFPRSAHPTIAWLAQETGETVMLGVITEDDRDVIYLDVVESENPLRFAVSVGDRRPLYCSAAGTALLAYLPEADRTASIEKTDFIKYTPRTPSEQELRRRLDSVAKTGLAMDCDGLIDGASGVAAASFDEKGAVVCSICVAAPSARIESARQRITALTLQAGEEISRILRYRGVYPPASTS